MNDLPRGHKDGALISDNDRGLQEFLLGKANFEFRDRLKHLYFVVFSVVVIALHSGEPISTLSDCDAPKPATC